MSLRDEVIAFHAGLQDDDDNENCHEWLNESHPGE